MFPAKETFLSSSPGLFRSREMLPRTLTAQSMQVSVGLSSASWGSSHTLSRQQTLRSLVVPASPVSNESGIARGTSDVPGYPVAWVPSAVPEKSAKRTIIGGKVAHWKGLQDEMCFF